MYISIANKPIYNRTNFANNESSLDMLNDIFFDQDFDIKKGVIEDEKSYIQS
jgi:hypothetical protein